MPPEEICPSCGERDSITTYHDLTIENTLYSYLRCKVCGTNWGRSPIGFVSPPPKLNVPDNLQPFSKYSEHDLVEILTALSLLAPYPDAIPYVLKLQKDVEEAIKILDEKRAIHLKQQIMPMPR